VLDTGSPHYVRMRSGVRALDVPAEGRAIRYSPAYRADGINVNFAEPDGSGGLFVRTYERGVEDETLSCGTGVTAAAIASTADGGAGKFSIPVSTPGGALVVSFVRESSGSVTGVVLRGPAVRVYDGTVDV
jgi:diaminopimelate epimerase